MAVAISESMEGLIKLTSERLNTMLRSVLATIETDLDIVFQSYQRSRVNPTAHNESRDDKIREFADEIRDLGMRHKELLQRTEGIWGKLSRLSEKGLRGATLRKCRHHHVVHDLSEPTLCV